MSGPYVYKVLGTRTTWRVERPIRQDPWTSTERFDNEDAAVAVFNQAIAAGELSVRLYRVTTETLGNGIPIKRARTPRMAPSDPARGVSTPR